MPAYIEKLGLCGLKWVNVHPDNRKYGLATVMAIIILSDPRNGFPLCIMDATLITNVRTGAAGAVAAKYLARKDSKVIGLVGCGAQAKQQFEGLRRFFNFIDVRLWSKDKACSNNFLYQNRYGKERIVVAGTIEECVRGSDIVVTTTPSRQPLVKYAWLKKGSHINAIGADAKGKEELEPLILKKAKVVVDDFIQAAHSGEINVPMVKGIINKKNIYAELGEIVCAQTRGRTNKDEITVFDSTGLAIQDLALANVIYLSALRKRIGKSVDLLGLAKKF
jgi:alanine dehydrogenase